VIINPRWDVLTAERAADIAQNFKTDARFENSDPQTVALVKIAISDLIRVELLTLRPVKPVEHEG